jgi:2-polyprenyl-3-methyl-5-hydroxy-6-metoxy-1,4-benzoquinol methylase
MANNFWDERYAGDQLAYGEAPNEFLVAMADRLPPGGRALDIGAGEGRNALYLASLGFDVLAIDQSLVGMEKAERLAAQRGLTLRTRAVDLHDFNAERGTCDVVTSIFVHLPAALRQRVHQGVKRWLKPEGIYLLEAYSPEQLSRETGGPKEAAWLASLDELLMELEGLTIEHQASLVRDVTEGKYHTGEAAVVQVVARKS